MSICLVTYADRLFSISLKKFMLNKKEYSLKNKIDFFLSQ